MEVKLSEISRRIIFRYYPVWFLSAILYCFVLKSLKWAPDLNYIENLLAGQISYILIFIFVMTSLSILKPARLVTQLTIMTISALAAIEMWYIVSGVHLNFGPIPFRGPLFASHIFHLSINNAFFVIWFFFIAERSCIADKKLNEEESKRLLNEKKIVANRLKLLQAQIEPQFLFNTLTNIVNLRDRDPEKAKTIQMHFIQYLRATLMKTRVSITTVEQEMELIQAYLDIYKAGTEQKFEYHIHIDNDVREQPLPSMLIQPVVENALTKDLRSNSQENQILISAQKRDSVIHIEVTNTWQELSGNNSSVTGLSNVTERIQSLFNEKGQLTLERNQPSGLKVIVEVPND